MEKIKTIVEYANLKMYQSKIKKEMKKMGASKTEIKLLKANTVRNGYKNKRKPQDVAWPILQ